jgi:hypothetical protein
MTEARVVGVGHAPDVTATAGSPGPSRKVIGTTSPGNPGQLFQAGGATTQRDLDLRQEWSTISPQAEPDIGWCATQDEGANVKEHVVACSQREERNHKVDAGDYF